MVSFSSPAVFRRVVLLILAILALMCGLVLGIGDPAPASTNQNQISSTHTAPKCVGDMKVGMSPEQIEINKACGNALAEANLQTQPQWVQDLSHANQAFADKATPLVAIVIAGALVVLIRRRWGKSGDQDKHSERFQVRRQAKLPSEKSGRIPTTRKRGA